MNGEPACEYDKKQTAAFYSYAKKPSYGVQIIIAQALVERNQ